MSKNQPDRIPSDALQQALMALADDELALGHRNSEWTGYGPILEEDIAFSNIAQDELGHALAFYTLVSELGNSTPDRLVFERSWEDFRCCRFVTYPKGDFAYTVVRQYLFDEAEQVRLKSMVESPSEPLSGLAHKILSEEAYHLIHSKGLVTRLGDATDESHQRMQYAVDEAFPQALGMFEELPGESILVKDGVVESSSKLFDRWIETIAATLNDSTLRIQARKTNGAWTVDCKPDNGGRKGNPTQHLKQLTADLQEVYKLAPGTGW